MKIQAPLFFATLIFVSCNDDPGKTDSTNENTPEMQLKTAVAKYPDSLKLRINLVEYYRSNQEYDKALSATADGIKQDSLYADFWGVKAAICISTDDTACAIASYEKAIMLDPSPGYLKELGYWLAVTENPKSVLIADEMIKANLQKEALFVKGIYYNKTDKQKAISFFDEALRLSYTFMEAYREKAITLYELGNYNEAINALQRALTVQSSYDEAYYWLGRCYEKLNKLNEAKENYGRAIDAAAQKQEEYTEAILALDSLQIKFKTKNNN